MRELQQVHDLFKQRGLESLWEALCGLVNDVYHLEVQRGIAIGQNRAFSSQDLAKYQEKKGLLSRKLAEASIAIGEDLSDLNVTDLNCHCRNSRRAP